MIMIVSNERDITCDYVVLELRRRGVPYFRLNTERLPTAKACCQWTAGKLDWRFTFDDREIKTSDISAGYFRRPGAPSINGNVTSSAERRYCDDEWAAVLRSVYINLEQRWLNAPSSIARAEDKALQLAVAFDVGFRVPSTVVTNDIQAATQFLKDGPAVGKSFYTGFMDDENGEVSHVMFTSQINNENKPTHESLSLCPVVFQREVTKAYDVRVTVVGQSVFAATIDSQVEPETTVDWRRGCRPDLSHSPHELPNEIVQKCLSTVQRLGLRFAAIDLVLDQTGNYWFLEANPNGQWAWIENRTGLQISSAIANELISISAKHGNHIS